MKKSLLFLATALITISSFAQSKQEIEAKEFFWGATDDYKNVSEIPEKWENESAVILYKNENYSFLKSGKTVNYKVSLRKRIKLLDKAAVEDYSEFSFKKRFTSSKGKLSMKSFRGKNIVGIKIIKPDGKAIELDVEKEGVEVDGEMKLAISNLEVGDIIDYYVYHIEPFKSITEFGFDPVETTLSESYPIVDFRLYFETENNFFINFQTYNGAPELKQLPKTKNKLRRYELVASHLEKNDFPRWYYPLVELPSYKFQVYFARTGKFQNRALAFLPEKEENIKSDVSKEEVLALYDSRFKPEGEIGMVMKFLKEKTFETDSEKVTAAYYFMRHYYLTRYVEAFYCAEAEIQIPVADYFSTLLYIDNQKKFIKYFTLFLKKNKIDYEIVLAKKRYDGSIDDLLLEINVNVLLKIKTSKPLYAQFFGVHTDINEYSPLIEDTDVLLLTASKNKIDGIAKARLPVSTYLDNESKKEMTVTINDAFSGISVASLSKYKGHAKSDEQYSRILFDEYVKEDYELYKTKTVSASIRSRKYQVKYEKELEALVEKLRTNLNEKLKKGAAGEFALKEVEDYEYELKETGRYGFHEYFTYSESFKAENALIKKAGPNYIVEIGKLIGGQIDLTEKERTRTANIYMNYPRSFNYEIKLIIPEGYTVSGLDNLDKNVDNVTGAFISSAKVEGDTLIITTSKQYKNNREPNKNWDLMIAFLDAAKQFTNEKILLKRS